MTTTTTTTTLAIATAVLLAACGGSDGFEPSDIPFSRVEQPWATTDLQQNYVIRTESEWRSVWFAHEPRTIPAPAPTVVDFSSSMVVGLTIGSGPNGCHALAVNRIVEAASQVEVQYTVATGAPGAVCTLAIVPLTDFVVIQRIDKTIIFRRIGDQPP